MTLDTFIEKFDHKNMVLFLGKNYADVVDEKVCSLPWKCIITTSSELGLVKLVKPQRHFTGYSKIPEEVCYSDSKDFVQLYGDGNIPDELSEIDDDTTRIDMEIAQGNSIFERLLGKLDARCEMVIAGYDYSMKDEMSISSLLKALLGIKGGMVSFLNCVECESLTSFALKRGFSFFSDSIKGLIQEWDPEEEIDSISHQEDMYIAYKNGRTISIPKDIVVRYEPIAQLLTDESIHSISPAGKIEKSIWFYNFLNNSAEAPQWYGYSDNSQFYLERKYEKNLLALTKNLLEGKIRNSERRSKIITIEGPSCSSKTIELGALAYKIFSEKNNPVIFIKGGGSSFSTHNNDIAILEELIQTIDDSDCRFLIIWDSSSMRNVLQEAKRLARYLDEDRGRRFVLVCSSYQITNTDERETPFPQWDNVTYYNDCYFVKADRSLTSEVTGGSNNEIDELKKRITEYAPQIDERELQNAYKMIGESVDIFEYYYYLIRLIRPKLEEGISREQRVVYEFAKRQIHNSLGHSRQSSSDIKELIEKAGFTVELNDDEDTALDERYEESLDEFAKSVALFSQFKLAIPFGLAKLVALQNSSAFNSFAFFEALTKNIDFIHYNSNSETTGKATFSFRNIIEARRFLKENNCAANEQMILLLKMIDLFVVDAEDSGEVDEEAKKAIVTIIRFLGPNNEGIDYDDEDSEVRSYFLGNIEKIIDKLQEARGRIHNIDEDGILACQEVTLVREYYGMQWKAAHGVSQSDDRSNLPYFTEEAYKSRLKRLYDNSLLAQEMIKKLEQKSSGEGDYILFSKIQNTISNLTVELCLSNIQFDEVEKEYRLLFSGDGSKEIGRIKTLPYRIQFNQLFKIIQKNQFNGYLYNTIFKLFFNEYDKYNDEDPKGKDTKLELLSEIMMIADSASTLNIENRGPKDHDELTGHIGKVYEYAAESDISIMMIKDPECKDQFKEVFDRLLNQNHAAAICFVCQRELERAGLGGRSLKEWKEMHSGTEFILSSSQIEKCQEIVEFLNCEKFETAIARSSQALYLKIRVYWMLYNRRPIDTGQEWQRTYLSRTEWAMLQELCKEYEASTENGLPIVSLIHSLSLIQCGEKYAEASKMVYNHRDSSGRNQFVNYMICKENGEPMEYSGVWVPNDQKPHEGFIRVDKIKDTGKGNNKVRCNIIRMGWGRKIPEENKRVNKFAMGLSYTGAYTATQYPVTHNTEEV